MDRLWKRCTNSLDLPTKIRRVCDPKLAISFPNFHFVDFSPRRMEYVGRTIFQDSMTKLAAFPKVFYATEFTHQ